MSATQLGDDDVLVEVAAIQGGGALGTVRAAGSRATSLVGKDVLVGPIDPCGECDVCRRGGAAVCPTARRRASIGAQVIAAARWVVPLGEGLDLPRPAAAAVPGDVVLAYTLYARTGIGPKEPVVVVGDTAIARFLAQILVAKGITPVVVGDLPASDAGAQATAAFVAQGVGTRPWRVITTSSAAVPVGAALAGPRATLTVLAPVPALPGELADREVTVIPVAGAHPDLVVEVAAMCVKGEIDLAGAVVSAPA